MFSNLPPWLSKCQKCAENKWYNPIYGTFWIGKIAIYDAHVREIGTSYITSEEVVRSMILLDIHGSARQLGKQTWFPRDANTDAR